MNQAVPPALRTSSVGFFVIIMPESAKATVPSARTITRILIPNGVQILCLTLFGPLKTEYSKTVQGNLGHEMAAFTLDVYGHVSEKMKEDSAARMEKYLQNMA